MRLASVAPWLREGSYFCRESAAVLHGLPLFAADLSRAHVLYTGGGHGYRSGSVIAYATRNTSPLVTSVSGLPVTSLAQTAADLMRVGKFGPALAQADAALRLGASPTELLRLVEKGRGCRIATEAVTRADGRSESPYESLARAIMLQESLPLPELQADLFDRWGGFIGRVDFLWRRARVIGEFDGATKYDELLLPGQSASDVLAAQEARQARLEASGWRVLRWRAEDLHERTPFVQSVREALRGARVDHALRPEAHDPVRERWPSRRRRRSPYGA